MNIGSDERVLSTPSKDCCGARIVDVELEATTPTRSLLNTGLDESFFSTPKDHLHEKVAGSEVKMIFKKTFEN